MTACFILVPAEYRSSCPAHLCDLRGVVAAESALVPDIADHHSFSGNRWDEPVEQEQHHSVIVKSLSQKPLAFLLLHDGLKGEVDIVILPDTLNEGLDLLVVEVDRLKKVVKPLDNV